MVNRRPLQITPDCLILLKKLQGKIKMISGKEPSLTELTEKIIKSTRFKDIEEQLINQNNLFEIKLKMDKRIL